MTELSQLEDRIDRALHRAAQAEPAIWADGLCSHCSRLVPQGNFCGRCGATFLTADDIFARRLIKPLGNT